MTDIQHGTVKVTIENEFAPPPEAGNLGLDEVRRIAKAPRGIGLICDATADAMEKAGAKFTAPGGVSPVTLRARQTRRRDATDRSGSADRSNRLPEGFAPGSPRKRNAVLGRSGLLPNTGALPIRQAKADTMPVRVPC